MKKNKLYVHPQNIYSKKVPFCPIRPTGHNAWPHIPLLTTTTTLFTTLFQILTTQTSPLILQFRLSYLFQILATMSAIAAIYALLFTNSMPKARRLCQKWEQQLGLDLTDEEKERFLTRLHKGSVNVTTQETGYKLWHRTPIKLHKLYPSIAPLCWRCGSEPCSLLHIWWSCPHLLFFFFFL